MGISATARSIPRLSTGGLGWSLVEPIEHPAFRRVIEKVPLDRDIARHCGAAGKAEDRVDRGDGGGFHSGGDVTDPIRGEIDLFAETATPVDVVAPVIK